MLFLRSLWKNKYYLVLATVLMVVVSRVWEASPLIAALPEKGFIDYTELFVPFLLILPISLLYVAMGLLFGSIHGSMIWMIYAAFMGCVLGYVRKHTGSVRPCVLMHMAFNGSSYLFTWFAEQYSEDSATVVFVFLASAFVLLLSMYGISFRTSEEYDTK